MSIARYKNPDGGLIRVWEVPDADKGPFVCVQCGDDMIIKRGKIYRHHFAHKSAASHEYKCNKGEWHAQWQSGFDDVEVCMRDRRADVVTHGGKTVIELQDSYLSPDDIAEREEDYEDVDLIWIFNFTNRTCEVDTWMKTASTGERYAMGLNLGKNKFHEFATERTLLDTPYGIMEKMGNNGSVYRVWHDVDEFAKAHLGASRDMKFSRYTGDEGKPIRVVERANESLRSSVEIEGFRYDAFGGYWWYGPKNEWIDEEGVLGEMDTYPVPYIPYVALRGPATFKYKENLKRLPAVFHKDSKSWIVRSSDANAILKPRFNLVTKPPDESVSISYFPGARRVCCRRCQENMDDPDLCPAMYDYEMGHHLVHECRYAVWGYRIKNPPSAVLYGTGTYYVKDELKKAGGKLVREGDNRWCWWFNDVGAIPKCADVMWNIKEFETRRDYYVWRGEYYPETLDQYD